MTQTQIQRVFAAITLGVMMATNFGTASAIQIGTGSVTGTPAFDSAINWSGDYTTGSASGSVEDIKITATVEPSLNMEIGATEIGLGTLQAGVTSTGTLNIEIGTNAKDGVAITARSTNGGLNHATQTGVQINDLTVDGLAESYKWGSTPASTHDSSNATFSASGLTALEVDDANTEHAIYTTNAPEAVNSVDDVEFYVSAKTSAETPAGLYEDYVTFTVTGNF